MIKFIVMFDVYLKRIFIIICAVFFLTESAPVYSESAPVHSESAPVHSEPAPVHSEPVPVDTKKIEMQKNKLNENNKEFNENISEQINVNETFDELEHKELKEKQLIKKNILSNDNEEKQVGVLNKEYGHPNNDSPKKNDNAQMTEKDSETKEKELIIATLKMWAKKWSEMNIDSYLSYYASDFKPSSGIISRKKWETRRRQRLNKKFIKVTINDPVITFQSPYMATIVFKQTYNSSNYNSIDKKCIIMKKYNDYWYILSEK